MKRVCSLALSLCVAASLAACSQGAASSSGSTAPSSAAPSSSVSQAVSESVSASSSESVSMPDSSAPASDVQNSGESSPQEESVLRGTLAAEAMSTITIRAEDGSEYTFLKDDIQEMDEVYEGDSVVCTYTGELGPEAVLTSVKLAS